MSTMLTPTAFDALTPDIIGARVEVQTRFWAHTGYLAYDRVRGYYVRTDYGRRVWRRSWTAARMLAEA